MSEAAKWYVVHTYSGYENKVKANIEKDDREQTPGRPDPGGTCSAAGCSGDEERNLKTGSEKRCFQAMCFSIW